MIDEHGDIVLHRGPSGETPPLTGPELARLRFDSVESRIRQLEHRVQYLERVLNQLLNGAQGEDDDA